MATSFSHLQQPAFWKTLDVLGEVRFKSSLSGGKGGQHTNKVSTKMELYWMPAASTVVEEEAKERIIRKLGKRLSNEGEIRLVCEEERSQILNKEKLIHKFYKLLASCFHEPKVRKPSKPTKSSIANRLVGKKARKEVKKGRGRVDRSE
jgi:ribosome-associated protein